MALKYDFLINNSDTGNVITDGIVYIQQNTNDLFTYIICLFLLIVFTVVFYQNTQDFGLSSARSLFATTIIATIIYYMGIYIDYSLFKGGILVALYLILSISGALLYYNRNKLGG